MTIIANIHVSFFRVLTLFYPPPQPSSSRPEFLSMCSGAQQKENKGKVAPVISLLHFEGLVDVLTKPFFITLTVML